MDNIQVGIRIRPLIDSEKEKNLTSQWCIQENTIFQVDDLGQRFGEPYSFDHIFNSEKTNKLIYDDIVKTFVESSLNGLNSTIFAYGQTSSGKTFTMLGNDTDRGIMVLAIENIFNSLILYPTRQFLFRMSYIEIYNEKIIDLLDNKPKEIRIRETLSGSIGLQNCKEIIVTSNDQVFDLLKLGNSNRHIGSTSMNDRSSRSHTILRFLIESREAETSGAVQVSCLNLVDLAGSERVAQTKATGVRLKEGGHINKSLSALALVIKQLSDGNEFINFRDSRLTRLLQDSLGGNAKTLIIATITLASVEDTHSTLSFAQRAKSVKNKPIINEIVSDQEKTKRYALLNQNLKGELEKQLQIIANLSKTEEASQREICRLQEQIQLLEIFQHGKAYFKTQCQKRRHSIGVTREKHKLKPIEEDIEDDGLFTSQFSSRFDEIQSTIPPFDFLSSDSSLCSREETKNAALTSDLSFSNNKENKILSEALDSTVTPKKFLRQRITELNKEFDELVTYTSEEQAIHKQRDKENEEMRIELKDKQEKLTNMEKVLSEKNEINLLQTQKIKDLEDQLFTKEKEFNELKSKFDQQEVIKYEEQYIIDQWKQKLKLRETELIDQVNDLQKENQLFKEKLESFKNNVISPELETCSNEKTEWQQAIMSDLLQLQEILTQETSIIEDFDTSQQINESLVDKLETSRQIIKDEITKQISKFDQFNDWLEDCLDIPHEIKNFNQLIEDFTTLNEVPEINDQKDKVDNMKFLLHIYECLLKIHQKLSAFGEKMRYDRNLLEQLKVETVSLKNKLDDCEVNNQTMIEENSELKKNIELLENQLLTMSSCVKKLESERDLILSEINESFKNNTSIDINKSTSSCGECDRHLETVKNCSLLIDELQNEAEVKTQSLHFEKESLNHYVNLTHTLDDQITSLTSENLKKYTQVMDLRQKIRELKKKIRQKEKENNNINNNLQEQLLEVTSLNQQLKNVKLLIEDQNNVINNLQMENQQIEKLQNDLESNKVRIKLLLDEKQQLETENESLLKQVEEFVGLKEEYQKQLECNRNILKEKENELMEVQSKIENSEKMWKEKISCMEEKLESLSNDIIGKDDEILGLKSVNDDLKIQLENVGDELKKEQMLKEEYFNKINNLSTELEKLNKINKDLGSVIEEQKKDNLIITDKNKELLESVIKLQKEVENLQVMNSNQNCDLKSELEIEALKRKLETLESNEENLKQNLSEINKDKTALEKLIIEKDEKIEKLTASNLEYTNEIDLLNKGIENLQRSRSQVLQLRIEIAQKNKEIGEKDKLLVTLRFENNKFQNQINQLNKQIDDNSAIITKQQEDIDKFQTQIKTLEEQLKNKINLLEECRNELKKVNISAGDKLKETVAKQAGEIAEQQKNLQKIIEKHSEEMKTVRLELEQVLALNKELKSDRDRTETEHQKLMLKLESLQKTNAQLISENKSDDHNQYIVSLEEELKEMATQCNNMSKSLKTEKDIYKSYEEKCNTRISTLENTIKDLETKLRKFSIEESVSKRVESTNCENCIKLEQDLTLKNTELNHKMKEIVKLQLEVYAKADSAKGSSPSADYLLYYEMRDKQQKKRISELEKKVPTQSVEIQCYLPMAKSDYDILKQKYETIKKVCVLRGNTIDKLTQQLQAAGLKT